LVSRQSDHERVHWVDPATGVKHTFNIPRAFAERLFQNKEKLLGPEPAEQKKEASS
jgi:hypothetical protein